MAAGDDWLDSRRVARRRAAAAQEMLDKRALETANPERAAALTASRSVSCSSLYRCGCGLHYAALASCLSWRGMPEMSSSNGLVCRHKTARL